MRTIGLFLQPLPIRIRRQSDRREDDIKEVRWQVFSRLCANPHGLLSATASRSSLMKIPSSSDDDGLRTAAAIAILNHPLFGAMVTFHELSTTGQLSSSVNTTILGIQPLVSWAEGATFGVMFEFSAISSSLVTLRVEYDALLFSADEHELDLRTRVPSPRASLPPHPEPQVPRCHGDEQIYGVNLRTCTGRWHLEPQRLKLGRRLVQRWRGDWSQHKALEGDHSDRVGAAVLLEEALHLAQP
ncbi:hypothetical protein DL767_004004 [Monosporascus sp. MG133]|nr:hypothetical protein DL767_004004 [Monosporascus sp. MG133]